MSKHSAGPYWVDRGTHTIDVSQIYALITVPGERGEILLAAVFALPPEERAHLATTEHNAVLFEEAPNLARTLKQMTDRYDRLARSVMAASGIDSSLADVEAARGLLYRVGIEEWD